MRYINRDEITFPEGWATRAQRATEVLKSLPPEERKQVLNKASSSKIWKDLKAVLQQCSHDKCWYCESKVTFSSPGDVDHFRPKNEVGECSEHPGYWWMAFDWDNYRFSCENCNRPNTDHETGRTAGKGTSFPLCDESKRVFDPTEISGILYEEPKLLDPTVASDPLLLTFDVDGIAHPARPKERSLKEYERAEKSIETYHLNRSKLKNRRQFEVCNKVMRLVARGDECLQLETVEHSVSARKRYNDVIEELCKMINAHAEYSAAARAVLKTYRDSDHEWVFDLLAAAS